MFRRPAEEFFEPGPLALPRGLSRGDGHIATVLLNGLNELGLKPTVLINVHTFWWASPPNPTFFQGRSNELRFVTSTPLDHMVSGTEIQYAEEQVPGTMRVAKVDAVQTYVIIEVPLLLESGRSELFVLHLRQVSRRSCLAAASTSSLAPCNFKFLVKSALDGWPRF